MAEQISYHPAMYRDSSIPLSVRLDVLEWHLTEELKTEMIQHPRFKFGLGSMNFTWGYDKSSRPEYFLELERQRQAVEIVKQLIGTKWRLPRTKPLDIIERDCFELLPDRFPSRLPTYDKSGLDIPLLVPRIPGYSWLEIADAAGVYITDELREQAGSVGEWKDPRKVTLPDQPYATWIGRIPRHSGDNVPLIDPLDARGMLRRHTRGATHWDGLALAMLRHGNRPFNIHYYDLIGSQVGQNGIMTIKDGPELHVKNIYSANRSAFTRIPLFCSREIVVRS